MVNELSASVWWPLAVALAWIVDRDLELAANGLGQPSVLLESLKLRKPDFDNALSELVEQLKAERVHAYGRTFFILAFEPAIAEKQAQNLNVPKDIDAREWFADHRFYLDNTCATSVRFKMTSYGFDRGYDAVLVRRNDVMRMWPKHNTRVQSLSSAEAECRKWLVEQIKLSPDSPPKTKIKFEEEAKGKFPKISGEGFRRAWANAIEESGTTGWGRAGRPKKSLGLKSSGQ